MVAKKHKFINQQLPKALKNNEKALSEKRAK